MLQEPSGGELETFSQTWRERQTFVLTDTRNVGEKDDFVAESVSRAVAAHALANLCDSHIENMRKVAGMLWICVCMCACMLV